LTCIKVRAAFRLNPGKMPQVHTLPEKWLPVSIAPSDVDLEVCVIDAGVVHALVFPCRKSGNGWVDVAMRNRIDIEPTHWRKWEERR
jgi:hypothetical protein